MQFMIANTFSESLTKLSGHEQKSVKTTAFDLQLHPSRSGMQMHRVDKAKEPNFWSVRVNDDLRIIIHKTDNTFLLCYVGHHDDAYKWAVRRRIEEHPTTRAIQIVQIREVIEEQRVSVPSPPPATPRLFAHLNEATLKGYGVPLDWIEQVQKVDEAGLLALLDVLPQEAAEALLEIATGGTPKLPASHLRVVPGFQHPDARRRFRLLHSSAELERALDYPWEQWTVFLHPAQQHLIERDYKGAARIAGSAGTGKTVVALHRAVFLARQHPTARVVILTFSAALANALQLKLLRLVGNEPAIHGRIQIAATRDFALSLYGAIAGTPQLATTAQLRDLLRAAAAGAPMAFSEQFLLNEWQGVVDAWQVRTWEHYRDVPRLGRRTRLGLRQRESLWQIFEQVQHALTEATLSTYPQVLQRIGEHYAAQADRPFDYAIVDESQDLDIGELRLLAQLGDQHPDSLFFTGDLGQRIFQQPFSWKAVGVDVRGRSHTLTINYRTSQQIRQQADLLLPNEIYDVDNNVEQRSGTISLFRGPVPQIVACATAEAEQQQVVAWLRARLDEGIEAEEIGIFVRSPAELARARAVVAQAGAAATELDVQINAVPGRIAISTMHLAKGLEFRAVAVIACDDTVLPAPERIAAITDESDLEDAYNTERYLLYVACTRAREYLLVSGVAPASEFLADMDMARRQGGQG